MWTHVEPHPYGNVTAAVPEDRYWAEVKRQAEVNAERRIRKSLPGDKNSDWYTAEEFVKEYFRIWHQ